MSSSSKRFVQKTIAVIVIVAVLDVVGVSPLLMLFVTGVVFVVWALNRRARHHELERIFNFYVAADAILRDEDRRWYGFEIAEVIEDGEYSLDVMPDCPALHLFALGALYYRIGKLEMTAEYLTRVVEDDSYDERQHISPSPQLRQYVSMLRRIEANPSHAPQQLAAVRSLERLRRKQAAVLLRQSRATLRTQNENKTTPDQVLKTATTQSVTIDETMLPSPTPTSARPPISEVLHDVYDDKSSVN
ncbi:MAG TPA: hypothetical protein VF074_05750 [Pyrinomonadaceae bacterium]